MILGILAFLLLFGIAGWSLKVEGFIQWMTLPVVRAVSSAAAAVGSLWPGDRLSANRHATKILEERQAALAVDRARLIALEEENRLLREQAGFLSSSGYESVVARVISRDVTGPRARLLIDRGLRDHLERGQAVTVGAGMFVGKIVELNERVSTVELITDENSRLAVSIAGNQTLVGVLEGRGNGTAVLMYVPVSASLVRDQLLTTAGTEEKIPAHLPVGLINAVNGSLSDPFLTATVEPLISLQRLSLVSVLRPSAQDPGL